eukprot:scaffold135879_cov49-Prasinocladus_malaysianus.AAC.2
MPWSFEPLPFAKERLTETFCLVALQVLSSPQLRERYDRDGAEGISASNLMDSSLFFGMLFGSEKFEHLVGELMISTAARCLIHI